MLVPISAPKIKETEDACSPVGRALLSSDAALIGREISNPFVQYGRIFAASGNFKRPRQNETSQ